jgi:hypothetical protein
MDCGKNRLLSFTHPISVIFSFFFHLYYRSADTGDPSIRSASQRINETDYASVYYPMPSISVNPILPLENEACIARRDFRDTHYDIYFTTNASLGVSRPWIPLLLLD